MAAMLARARSGLISEALIGGSWARPMGKGVLTIVNPADSSDILTSAACGDMEVNLAVQAARDAFVAWSGSSFQRRREVLRAAAAGIQASKQDLAALESLNTGKPLREAEGDMDECIAAFEHCATMTERLEKESEVGQGDLGDGLSGTIRKEPLGVVAGVCPWNYPAMMASWKIAPALAAGCTAVIKPSELTPFTTLALGKVLEEAGLPAGCLSVLPGGKGLGASLVGHPDIDKVSFTGSSQVGAAVMRSAAGRANPVTLELGGKSPSIILEDADLDQALEWILFGSFWNCGQICSATSRILVHESRLAEFTERLVEAVKGLSVGGPFEEDSAGYDMGPLISATQLNTVSEFVRQARAEGNVVLTGGGRPKDAPDGFFFEPTVVGGVGVGDTLWRQEVFGPVVSITPFATNGEAVQLANDTNYGLAASVYSTDDVAMRSMSRSLRVGTVWENCSQPVPTSMPWGGYKQSGIGREMGPGALDGFLEVKSITTKRDPAERLRWFSGFRV